MRILKYIFLLLVLISVAIVVYIATQRGDYEFTESKIINSTKGTVYSYVNEYHNWEDWISWEESQTKFAFPAVTAGKGGSFSWSGEENNGRIRTVFAKESDSIAQKFEANGHPGEMYWTFKDTLGKTKVTLHIKGKMAFKPKVYAALRGGPEKVMRAQLAKNLARLNRKLDYEINTYKVNVDGIFIKPASFYLCQSITSTLENMPRNMRIMMDKMIFFFRKNNIPMAGKPFVLYKTYDAARGISKFSVCIPVKEEIFITPGSDIASGKVETLRAVRTTLHGDYSHLREAYDKSFDYIKSKNLEESGAEYLELYKIGKIDSKSPSKWITEIYIPIKYQSAPAVQRPAPLQTAATPSPQSDSGGTDGEISIP
jgi:effector-binding domain-containing protein